MTLNELSILKNGVLDATEAYVDARLENLPFAKTEIGVVSGVYIEKTISGIKTLIPVTVNTPISNDKLLHTVRVGSSNRYKEYKNVLSVGNIEYEIGAVVFIIVPNGQYSNSFIMGKLDTSPVNVNGGELHIGKMPSIIDGKEYYFNVDKQGNVEMLKGSLKYNYNNTLQDYSFIVDKNGIKSGINGTSPSDKDWFFKLDNQGNVKIEHGSIKLGKINTTKYRFEVDDNGNITRRDANGKEIFKVDDTGVEISGYLEDGAFNTSTRSNRTKIDGTHIQTGYIISGNLSGQSSFADYDGKFTKLGTVIGLDKGFLSSKQFYIKSNGDVHFKGTIDADAGGTIGPWTINNSYLTATVDGYSAYISPAKMHLLSKDNGWQQVCFNPKRNRCYLSGIDLYLDGNSGDLNGDTHSNGSSFLRLTTSGISHNDKHWIDENGFHFLDNCQGYGIEKLTIRVHDNFIELGNLNSNKWTTIFLNN